MTAPAGNLLRPLAPGEAKVEAPSISGDGFTLVPSSTKIFVPSGAPVILYDIMTPASPRRVGIGSLILETDPKKVALLGSVCASALGSHPDPTLQAKAGGALVQHALGRGLTTPLIVVPTDQQPSIDSATFLSPSLTALPSAP